MLSTVEDSDTEGMFSSHQVLTPFGGKLSKHAEKKKESI